MESIDRIKDSVTRLMEQVRELKEQNSRLAARAIAAEARAAASQAKMAQMESQLTASLLKGSISDVAGGSRAAKLRINRLIRDIDKCIAMVSKG